MNDLRPLSIAPVTPGAAPRDSDLICFSHLRWDFVFQRPQHLMERFARHRRVLFVEETIPTAHHLPYLEFHAFDGTPVTAVRPRLPDRVARGGGRAPARRPPRPDDGAPRHPRPGAVVLHADALAGRRPPRRGRRRGRLRLHGRALRLPTSRRRSCRANEAALLAARRPRLHRRPRDLRGQARRSTTTSTPSPRASTSAHFRRARGAVDGAGRPGGDPGPAPRLLRRHRRAHRPAARRRRRGRPARLVVRDDRPGGEDRPRAACRARRTSTSSASGPTPSSPTIWPAGTWR